MRDSRSHRIVLVAHCLLNQNSKVAGLASYSGVFTPLISLLVDAGVGIVQLPCPEFVHLGPSRPVGTDTVEQYDTSEYRATCVGIRSALQQPSSRTRRPDTKSYAYWESREAQAAVYPALLTWSHSIAPNSNPEGGFSFRRWMIKSRLAGVNIPLLGVPESEEAGELPLALARLRRLLEQ